MPRALWPVQLFVPLAYGHAPGDCRWPDGKARGLPDDTQ